MAFQGNFLMNIEFIKFEILINNLIFSKNVIRNQMIQILNSRCLYLQNIWSEMTNFESKLAILGGFLRTSNILYRVIHNVTIINSFSDLTTVGIKIIDDSKILESHFKSIFGYTSKISVKIKNF